MQTTKRINNIKSGDYFKKANLHIHSTFSDGKIEFDNLVEQAHALNLEHIAITDHNTVEGYKKSKYKNDPILIPSVEFDCIEGHCFIHILGYGIDIENEKLLSICAKNPKHTKDDIRRLLHSRKTKDAIDAIHEAGGIAVLAHPCCYWAIDLDKFVKKIIKMGLDGIEVYYPYDRFRGIVKFHSRRTPKKLAEKYNLIKTGGCDNHGNLKDYFSM